MYPRPIGIDFEFSGSAVDPYGNVRIGFEGHTTINRKDWNVTWNAPLEAGGVLVSDKVTLEFDVRDQGTTQRRVTAPSIMHAVLRPGLITRS